MGFMAEELSSKLKSRLRDLTKEAASVLVITRDNVLADELLLEQSVLAYEGLAPALSNGQYTQTFPIVSVPEGGELKVLRKNIERHTNFSFTDCQLKGPRVKQKLKGDEETRTRLFITKIGKDASRITDVYLQFPEMGYQPNLAVKLMAGILRGLLEWFVQCDSPAYNKLYFEAFGAGGSMHPDYPPGISAQVKGVWSVRRFLRKQHFVGASALKFFGVPQPKNSHLLYNTEENNNHDAMAWYMDLHPDQFSQEQALDILSNAFDSRKSDDFLVYTNALTYISNFVPDSSTVRDSWELAICEVRNMCDESTMKAYITYHNDVLTADEIAEKSKEVVEAMLAKDTVMLKKLLEGAY